MASSRLITKGAHAVKWIPVGELDVVWVSAQRPLNRKRAQAIADNLDPDALGVIAVARPVNSSSYHIIDGQHRVEAVRIAYGQSEQVPCMVIEDVDSLAEAADTWLRMNTDRTKPTGYETFRVAVAAGRPTEVAVNEAIEQAGYRVGYKTVMAVAACTSVYKKGGHAALVWTLETLAAVFGRHDPAAVSAPLIQGMWAMAEAYGIAHIDITRLSKQVSERFTPARLIGTARTARETLGVSVAEGVRHVMATAYNKGLGEARHLVRVSGTEVES